MLGASFSGVAVQTPIVFCMLSHCFNGYGNTVLSQVTAKK